MVSFVVPAYNEELLLARTLQAIHRAAQAASEPYEIVVGDDTSSDGTAAVAEANGARVVRVAHRHIAATRNSGGRAARGETLVFVDADTLVNATVVRGAIRAVRGGAAGGGCAVRIEGRLPLYARLIIPLFVCLYQWVGLAGGCFLFCTRRAFDAIGGFDEGLFAAEEAAMSQALKRQGRFVILRQHMTTSGRKLRTHSARAILGVFGRVLRAGPAVLRQRQGLDLWYGERRTDHG